MKVYLIIRDYLSELGGSDIKVRAFQNEEKAREVFSSLVNELMCDYDGVCDICDTSENSAEFYNEGTYLEWHDCVTFEEKEME